MIIVSGIHVEVCRKNVKNMRLYVKPPDGKAVVTAPLSMAYDEIESFVQAKAGWIKTHVDNYKNIQIKPKQKFVSGETLIVWGEEYILQVKNGGKNSILLSGEKAVFTVKKGITAEKREKFVREWYRKLLITGIEKFLPKWEKKTGLKAEIWQTKYMKTRWGSCKPKQRKICLNVQLTKSIPQCLEYVILHELVHFIERGHNARFKSLLDKYMPDWREVKKILNRQILD
ncbi:MAG: M48 family metallopeptidase [Treponema sp.]|nr:M48 family metallopeptidase [Treponema sp.]